MGGLNFFVGGDENSGRRDKEEVMKVKGGSGQCTIINVAGLAICEH